ncbi:MAG: DUF2924 domain-containing protein [Gemmatimonadota bacterium]|jgi:phage protein D
MAAKSTKKAARKKAAKRTPKKKAATKRAPKKAARKRSTRAKATPKAKAATPAKAPAPRERDPRLPRPGGILTRTFKGKEIKVEVLDAGFRYDGKTWRSLSAIAKEVSQTSWNGYLFFGLQTRAKMGA